MRKACRDARRECMARAGDDGNAHPQGIGCRGVPVIRKGIEIEIGEAMARQMGRGFRTRRKHEALRRDAARFRFAP